jgi:hypothetical protein
MIFFEEDSPNKDVNAAIGEAERVRKALRQEEHEEAASTLVARANQEKLQAELAEPATTTQIERRTYSKGREF